MKLGRPWDRQDPLMHTSRRGPGGREGRPHLGHQKTRRGSDLPDTFVELDGEADNLVVAQSSLLLLQDLAAVLIGPVGDCGRRGL